MPAPELSFSDIDFLAKPERATIRDLWLCAELGNHPGKPSMLISIATQVSRVAKVAEALESFPPVFQERTLGSRQRNLDTLVDHLAQSDDSNYEMYLPTRALVGRTLVMAELNLWRMLRYICREIQENHQQSKHSDGLALALATQTRVDDWLHGCVYTLLAEEVLGAISRNPASHKELRTAAVDKLCSIWGNYLHWSVRDFFPLLQATWSARRRIRVSLGTLLGVSELMRLLQAGCDPEFVEYFTRPNPTLDEGLAFQEFLIGVPTEQIRSLEHLMKQEGITSMSREEAETALGIRQARPEDSTGGVQAYRFFRERHLQAAARRLRDEPGPRRTAEEYVMIYFLENELSRANA
jgi:hypothetical protein